MKCTDMEELLSAYANNELRLMQREFVEEHLDICPDCRASLADYVWVRQSLTSLKTAPVEADITKATMSKIGAEEGAKRPIPRLLKPALIGVPLIAAIVVSLVLWLPGGGVGIPIAQAHAANSALQSYGMRGSTTSAQNGTVSEAAFIWEFVEPERSHGTLNIDGVEREFIILGDEQYVRTGDGVQSSGSVVIMSDSLFDVVPSIRGALRLIDSLKDVEALPTEQLEAGEQFQSLHYRGAVDMDRIIDGQIAALDPQSPEYEATVEALDMQRSIKIDIDLWIGEEDYWIRQLKFDAQLPAISSGPQGVEQKGWVSYSTIARYYDFNKPIEIEQPFMPSGELQPGWQRAGGTSSPAPTVTMDGESTGGDVEGSDVGSNTISVRLLLYSGRPDPEWELDKAEAEELIARVKQTLVAETVHISSYPTLGGRGFGVEHAGNIVGIPRWFMVFDGVLVDTSISTSTGWRDTGGVEEWLMDQARQRGFSEALDTCSNQAR